jgi:hypothetical protein
VAAAGHRNRPEVGARRRRGDHGVGVRAGGRRITAGSCASGRSTASSAGRTFDIAGPQPLPTEPVTRAVAELFNLGYEMLLWLMTRFSTHTGETGGQLDALTGSAFALMGRRARAARAYANPPARGPGTPWPHRGPHLRDVLPDGNFIPSRGAAWAVMPDRAAMLAARCADVASHAAAPLRSARQPRRRPQSRHGSLATCPSTQPI